MSSTGHLILAGDLLGFNTPQGKVFEVVIQTGAMLAVVWDTAHASSPRCGASGRRGPAGGWS